MGRKRHILFLLFLLSGFCGLLYQVVWLRKAFAAFGVITPVLSVVISVFMLGLALGSWLGGRWIGAVSRSTKLSPLIFYGLVELVIASGAVAVPALFEWGQRYLLTLGEMDSSRYLAVSAVLIAACILPWCIALGATFPLVMAYIKQNNSVEDSSFSFLYLANVIGAMLGASLTALVLIELLGFARTLYVAASCNLTIAAISFWLGRDSGASKTVVGPAAHATRSAVTHRREMIRPDTRGQNVVVAEPNVVRARSGRPNRELSRRQDAGRGPLILFVTGFTSMAMEVVWTRAFTPVMKTTIYAFALILTVYLLATWSGSFLYRRHLSHSRAWSMAFIGPWLAVTAILPLLLADPRLGPGKLQVLVSIFPFSALLGYLTPKLVDDYSLGDPRLGGWAYSINILGCILGPLVAAYWILPHVGVKWALIVLAIPFLLYVIWDKNALAARRAVLATNLVAVALAVFWARTHEDGMFYNNAVVRRDHTATVVSAGEGMGRRLLVNGIGITHMTPITKIMAHLPLSTLSHPPESALVICFGMGTTFRSLMSWGIATTAVELVPSVRDAFGYYFPDAGQLLADPRGLVVIDDGRRFLRRSQSSFDVITLDPPPPVEAAGSSLLYSVEFYDSAKARLKPDGILQQWFPGGEAEILHAVAASIRRSFPYVRVYHSIENWGYHFLASRQRFDAPTAAAMVSRMPETAKRDLMEWYPGRTLEDVVAEIVNKEIPLEDVLGPQEDFFVADDNPINEYYMLRRQLDHSRHAYRFAK